MSGTEAPIRLVSLDELDERQVTTVQTPHGTLAVGISGGEPFAVSNRCRHLFASLGTGRVAEDGCLECPWHDARYDVRSGAMTARSPGRLQAARGLRQGDHGSAPAEDVSREPA